MAHGQRRILFLLSVLLIGSMAAIEPVRAELVVTESTLPAYAVNAKFPDSKKFTVPAGAMLKLRQTSSNKIFTIKGPHNGPLTDGKAKSNSFIGKVIEIVKSAIGLRDDGTDVPGAPRRPAE